MSVSLHDVEIEDRTAPVGQAVLRPLTLADASFIATTASRPEVARMIAMVPLVYPAPAADMFILGSNARERGRGDLTRLVTGPDGTRLGVVGLASRGEGRGWEFGYWYAPEAWGRGYATQAGRALLELAAERGCQPIEAGYFDDNPASCRVLEKLGFRPTGEVCDTFSFGRTAKTRCVRMALTGRAGL